MLAFKSLEFILLENSWVTEHQLFEARRRTSPRQTLVEGLIEAGVEARRLATAVAQLYRLPIQINIDQGAIDPDLVGRIPADYARKNRLLPLASDGSTLFVATADPSNYAPLDDLAVLFRMLVQPIVVPFDVLGRITRSIYETNAVAQLEQIIDLQGEDLEAAARMLSEQGDELMRWNAPPVLNLVKALIGEAISEHAHEIYFEPLEHELMVRFRAASTVYNLISSPKCYEPAIISCVKVRARMSALPRPTAQQGQLCLRAVGRILIMSVSVLPHQFGEQLILRLSGHGNHAVDQAAEPRASARESIPASRRIMTQGPVCAWCGDPVVVAAAVFCKNCGAPLMKMPTFVRQLPNRHLPTYPVSDQHRSDWKLF